MIKASEMKHDCKRLSFGICLAGMEDHHERAWMIFERGTICMWQGLGQGGPCTYGTIDGPGGPSMAAILGPGRPSTARKNATDGPGDQFWGTIGGMPDRAHKGAQLEASFGNETLTMRVYKLVYY